MNRSAAPTLDELASASHPAWLWDAARCRIVWANPAGIAALGGDTLFDLLDLPFNPGDPSVRRLRQLARELDRGRCADELLDFPNAVPPGEFAARCFIHALADGRNGVLVVAQAHGAGAGGLEQAAARAVVGALPVGLIVATMAGEAHFANTAALQALAGASPARLLGQLRADDTWDRLCHECDRGRSGQALARVETPLGPVDLKLTATAHDGAAGSGRLVSLLVQDVTERRALERSLLDRMPAPAGTDETAAPAQGAAEPAAAEEASLSEDDARAFARIGKALENVRLETSAAAASRPPAPDAPAPSPAPVEPFAEVPEIVVRTLGPMPRAMLLHDGGKLIYANERAGQLFGYADGAALAGHAGLDDLLSALDAGDGPVEATARDGTGIAVRAETSPFPWRTGSVSRSILYPVEAAADAGDRATAEQAAPPASLSVVDAVTPPQSEPGPEPGPEASAPPEQPAAAAPAPAAGAEADPDRAGAAEMSELRAILDTATDGVVTLDAGGKVISFSAGAQALFGYEAKEALGKPFAGFFTDDSRRVVEDYLAALGDSGLASVFNDGREVEASVKQGGGVPVFLTLGRLQPRSGGKPASAAAFCAVVRDITQWKKTEAELKGAKERAERSSAQKSEFLARISHELRTPLNAILGFSDVMRTERFGEIRNEKYLGYANDIHTSGGHLLSLINDLLDLSKVEAGKLELNFTSVNLGSVIDGCMKLMTDQATARRVVLRKQVQSGLPNVVADIRSLRQILLNLISNAIKFTEPGGQVIVSARTSRNGELKLRVKDTGIGMDEAELAEALEPFTRVRREGHEETEGTGLGLPLSRALTEANRAVFAISSEPGKGTLVEVTFPTTRVLAE